MKKVLCIGASISLPRENVPYEDTWYYMLSEKWKNKCCFIHYFTRALLMPQIEMQYDSYYKYYDADYVIWQSGLTDSAPRIINERAPGWRIIINIVNRLGWKKYFWKLIKLFFKRDPKCVNTSYETFCKSAERVVDAFVAKGVKKIIIIKIGQVGESVQRKSPHWQSNIQLYNTCYENLKNKYPDNIILIDPLKEATEKIYVDGMHTNREGAIMVFKEVDKILTELI